MVELHGVGKQTSVSLKLSQAHTPCVDGRILASDVMVSLLDYLSCMHELPSTHQGDCTIFVASAT
jgi:hypothetical protein